MRTKAAIGVLIAVAGLLCVRSSAGQVQPVPGPGTGIVTVSGTVDVGNVPSVNAGQRGDWKVAVSNAPDVRVVNTPTVAIAPVQFLKAGSRYEIVWSAGDREVIGVAQLGSEGWVRVNGGGRRRWVNIAAARAVEEIP